MRIAVVAGFPPDPYGEAHYSGQVFLSLAKQFPNVTILVAAHKNYRSPNRENLAQNLLVKRITRPKNRLQATATLIPLLYHLLMFKPDLVHFQGTHTPRYGGLFGEPVTLLIGFLRLFGIKVLYTAHSIWLPFELNKLWKMKHISDLFSEWLTKLYGFNIRLIAKWSNMLSFVIAGDSSLMVDSYINAYKLESFNIVSESHPCTYKPISNEQKKMAKEYLGLVHYRIALAVGFITPDKGYHLLVDCADKVLNKHFDLLIIIAGEPKGLYGKRYASILEKKRMSFTSKDRILLKFEYLEDADFLMYLDAADAVVVPYLSSIGPSGPIHHALGCGKPVIASALGHNLGLESVCKLFRAGDSTNLGEVLDDLLCNPQQMELAIKKSNLYAVFHTWDKLAKSYMERYRLLQEL